MSYKNKIYSERTDIEKIQSNWKKISGLYSRREWSSAVVRAATSAEIATNLVIREELENGKNIDKEFVSHLMIWANGIQGKYQRLIIPAVKNKEYEEKFKSLSTMIGEVNRERNKIVHGGSFTDSEPAHEIIEKSKNIILEFVCQYNPDFQLSEIQLITE